VAVVAFAPLPAGRRAALAAALAARLPDQRWYGDKGRPIAAVAIDDLAAAPADPEIALAIVRVGFESGDGSRYLWPVALGGPSGAEPGMLLPPDAGMPAIVDALTLPRFPAWLLDRLTAQTDMRGDLGRLRWTAFAEGAAALRAAHDAPAAVLAAEQSNSAVRYGDAVIVKLFRRLRDGVNPDLEVGRFLWEETAFRQAPAPVAAASYLPDAGGELAIAFAQAFVPNAGDGWIWTLRELTAALASPDEAARQAAFDRYVDAAAMLGRRAAELHRALASRPDDLAFAPEPLPDALLRDWAASLRRRLRSALAELAADSTAPPAVAALVPALRRSLPALEARADGFSAEAGNVAIRVHGDFHLGQTLRTGDDWTILDFEGEPARPLAERRAKTSALKDVAGMLRSFAYARGAVERADPTLDPARRAALASWERASRQAFLDAYRPEIALAAAPIAPADAPAFHQACDAWELDKAVYEIAYERRNRPDWLEIPLAALLREPAG
jgi:maltose alpha-D-glucosyltransferase / alpha-amylase